MNPAPGGPASGRIITFYSYKGGTGRSMALANIAWLLAEGSGRAGKSAEESGLLGAEIAPLVPNRGVLAIDWDLEAPGLHRYFRPFLPGGADGAHDDYDREQPGLIDLFVKLDKATRRAARDDAAGGPASSPPSVSEEIAASVIEDAEIASQFIVPTSLPGLSFMKAGRFDDHYSRRVGSFRWDHLYERAPSLIPALARYLSDRFSYVLIDSRTGVTDTSGICTTLMPELLVLVFTPNLQSLTGVVGVIQESTQYRMESPDIRPLVIFPLPSRIELARPQLLDYWRNGSSDGFTGFQAEFESAFAKAYDLDRCDLTGYFDEIQIQHVPDYAYGEQIAVAVEESDNRLSLRRSYESFVRRLIGLATPWTDPRSAAAEAHVIELCRLGNELLRTGRIQQAQRQFNRAFDAYRDSDSFPVPELEEGLRKLGAQLIADGQPSEAETVLDEAVQVAERSFGPGDARVADSLQSLGEALTAMGKVSEALEVTRRARNLRVEALGPRHPSVADLDDKMGELLAGMGRLNESYDYFVQGLSSRRAVLGPHHPAVALSLQHLADTATAMGNLREADEFLQQALDIGTQESPAARARILGSLGELSLRKRDLGAAERYLSEAADILASAGPEDPAAAGILDGLAQVSLERGDFEQAQSRYERAQLIREDSLGPSHPETLRSIVNLGDLARAQRQWSRAETHYRRLISLVERTTGVDHPLAAEAFRKLGGVAQAQGDYDLAERHYQRAAGIDQELGNQAGLASSYGQLGVLAALRGDYERAEVMFRRALEINEQLGNQAGMASSSRYLGILAQDRGDYDSAEARYHRALEISERLGDQAGLATSYHQLGTLETARGSAAAAIDWYVKAFIIRARLDNPQRTDDLRAIAAERHRLGTEEFVRLLTQAAGPDDALRIASDLDQLESGSSNTDGGAEPGAAT